VLGPLWRSTAGSCGRRLPNRPSIHRVLPSCPSRPSRPSDHDGHHEPGQAAASYVNESRSIDRGDRDIRSTSLIDQRAKVSRVGREDRDPTSPRQALGHRHYQGIRGGDPATRHPGSVMPHCTRSRQVGTFMDKPEPSRMLRAVQRLQEAVDVPVRGRSRGGLDDDELGHPQAWPVELLEDERFSRPGRANGSVEEQQQIEPGAPGLSVVLCMIGRSASLSELDRPMPLPAFAERASIRYAESIATARVLRPGALHSKPPPARRTRANSVAGHPRAVTVPTQGERELGPR
jgi:hypothetical protein